MKPLMVIIRSKKYRLKNILTSHKLFKETAWSFISKGVAFLLYFVLNLFLARYLGTEQFGEWSFFLSILNIVLLLSYFGIDVSARVFIARYNGTSELKPVIRSSLKLCVIFSFIFSIFTVIISKPLAGWLDRPSFEIMLFASVPLVFFAGLVEFLKNAFQGLHRLKYDFYTNLAEHGLKLFLTLCFLFYINEIIGIIFAYNLACIVTTMIGLCLLYCKFYKKAGSSESNYTQQILRYSVPLFIAVISLAIATELDTLMIGILSTDHQVGIYAVAKQLINKLPHISVALSLGTMPVFAQLDHDNWESLKALFYRLLRINTIIFGLISFLILSIGWFFVPLFFGQDYSESVLPLLILVPYLVCYSYSVLLGSLLDYQKKAKKRALALTLATLLNVGLNFALIPRYGAFGAAIATSVSYLPYLLFLWIEVKKTLALYHEKASMS